MRKIILSGCCGHMGTVLSDCIDHREDCVVVAGIDTKVQPRPYPVFTQPEACSMDADVLIDFSNAEAVRELLPYARGKKLPMVIATTGMGEEQMQEIREASHEIPIFQSANMSLGVNLLMELVKTAAKTLGGTFDVEIIEAHHNRKVDAPSGTAVALAQVVQANLPHPSRLIYDRHGVRQRRDQAEIGIHSIRGGTVVGEHQVFFAGRDETLTLTHAATSRKVFATGAICAALFLCEQRPGLYSMADLLAGTHPERM